MASEASPQSPPPSLSPSPSPFRLSPVFASIGAGVLSPHPGPALTSSLDPVPPPPRLVTIQAKLKVLPKTELLRSNLARGGGFAPTSRHIWPPAIAMQSTAEQPASKTPGHRAVEQAHHRTPRKCLGQKPRLERFSTLKASFRAKVPPRAKIDHTRNHRSRSE